MHELKSFIKDRKVIYGIKETVKNAEQIERAFITADCREHIKRLLDVNKIKTEVLDLSKEDIAISLELKFKCEVFGLKK